MCIQSRYPRRVRANAKKCGISSLWPVLFPKATRRPACLRQNLPHCQQLRTGPRACHRLSLPRCHQSRTSPPDCHHLGPPCSHRPNLLRSQRPNLPQCQLFHTNRQAYLLLSLLRSHRLNPLRNRPLRTSRQAYQRPRLPRCLEAFTHPIPLHTRYSPSTCSLMNKFYFDNRFSCRRRMLTRQARLHGTANTTIIF